MKGIDTPHAITSPDAVKQAGYSFVVRYLSLDTLNFPTKRLTKPEAHALSEGGLWIGSVWETFGKLDDMSPGQGGLDAHRAIQVAEAVGEPCDRMSAIYFAVDFDAAEGDLPKILSYFDAIHPTLKDAGLLTGCYGSGLVCGRVVEEGFAHYAWLSGSMGWAGSREHAGWGLRQIVDGAPRFSADADEISPAVAGPQSIGLWRPQG